MSLDYVRRWYESLPPFERMIPLVPHNGKIYSPQRVLDEVRKGTPLGEELQRILEEGRFTTEKDLENIAMKRLEWIISNLPNSIGLATLTLGQKPLSKEDLLEMVKKKQGIGRKLLYEEMKNVKRLLEGSL